MLMNSIYYHHEQGPPHSCSVRLIRGNLHMLPESHHQLKDPRRGRKPVAPFSRTELECSTRFTADGLETVSTDFNRTSTEATQLPEIDELFQIKNGLED